jgi:hypothetical protein
MLWNSAFYIAGIKTKSHTIFNYAINNIKNSRVEL